MIAVAKIDRSKSCHITNFGVAEGIERPEDMNVWIFRTKFGESRIHECKPFFHGLSAHETTAPIAEVEARGNCQAFRNVNSNLGCFCHDQDFCTSRRQKLQRLLEVFGK